MLWSCDNKESNKRNPTKPTFMEHNVAHFPSLRKHTSFVQASTDDLVILISGICKTTAQEIAQRYLTNININRWDVSNYEGKYVLYRGLNTYDTSRRISAYNISRILSLENTKLSGCNFPPKFGKTYMCSNDVLQLIMCI